MRKYWTRQIFRCGIWIVIEKRQHVLLLPPGGFRFGFRVLELGDDLSLVTSRVVVVSVHLSLLLGPLLAGFAAEHGLVLIEVEVLVLVEVLLGHF